jgi:poly(beta-D-mannuronate) lyase
MRLVSAWCLVSGGLLGAAAPAAPATRPASSIAELQARLDSAEAGDRVVLKDGTYATQAALTVRRRHGSEAAPIVIEPESKGGATLAGAAGFVFEDASWVTVQGFRFAHAGTTTIDADSHHVRLARNVFELAPEARHWVLVEGDDVEIDHNVFQNKKTVGVYVAVTGRGGDPATTMAQRTHIHHNGFYDHSFPGANGGEGIRLGLSSLSLFSAHALIEDNLFEHHNGDPEAVSVKSSDNVVRGNTVRDSKGGLVLRHGNRTTVEGNFILSGRCGIRFYGNDHHIVNNYVADGTGVSPQEPGWGAALTIGSGSVADHLPEHTPASRRGRDAPERVVIAFNTFVDNAQSVAGEHREFPPRDCIFANNVIRASSGPLVSLGLDPPQGFKWEGNVLWGAPAGDVPAEGYRRVDPELVLVDGLYRPAPKSPLIDAAAGAYPEVDLDMDGQGRGERKDVGADEASALPVARRPLTRADVGPDAP